MANPTPRALARARLGPSDTPHPKKRGAGKNGDIATARTYLDTSSHANAALVSPDKPLTEKQKQFVKHWAQGESITSASVRAGYNDGATIAYRMVRMPNILALKHEYEKKYEKEAQMSRALVLEGFKDAIAMATLMSEPMSMIAGWREIGKLCGYYAPVETRVKMSVEGSVVMERLSSLSDAELLEMVEDVTPKSASTKTNWSLP